MVVYSLKNQILYCPLLHCPHRFLAPGDGLSGVRDAVLFAREFPGLFRQDVFQSWVLENTGRTNATGIISSVARPY